MNKNLINEKAKNFFEYLLSLNNLVGKVTRDFSEFEKNWHMDELQKLEGVLFLEDCQKEENIIEIHRPNITEKEKRAPKPDKILTGWIDFDINNENLHPSYVKERSIEDEEGEVILEAFNDNKELVSSFTLWVSEWKEWAEVLKEKKRVLRLYGEFFDLISRMEKEGEALEFVFGKGLLCWKHPNSTVGTIRSPLLTTKLELEIDAEHGVISAKQVDKVVIFEREMFSGIQIPNINQINQLIRKVQSVEITDDLSDFFTQFIQLLDANGRFIEESTQLKVEKEPKIYNQSIFSLRSKSVRVLRDDLEHIIAGVSSGEIDITDTVASILGESSNKVKENESVSDSIPALKFTENNLYFPLESNEQQKEIVNRVERNYGVTVQGPPGTGKTHTIANLVSHFLSEGKKILITSQKESPLKVLKNKIPKEVRDLCVPVLGGGRESLQEIEQSIRVIGEKLGELDMDRLEKEIIRDKEDLDKSKRFEAQLKNQLKLYSEKEGTELNYKGEKLFKYDVAKRLSESKIDYSWIQDDAPIEKKFPVSTLEFNELWELKGQLSKEDLLLENQFLPIIDDHIKSIAEFSSFIESGRELEKFNDIGQEVIEKYFFPSDLTTLDSLLTDLKTILNQAKVLENSDYVSVIEDCKAGGVREQRWRNLLTDIESANEKMFEHYNNLVTHKINLPDKDLTILKEEVNIAKERLMSGKSPNFMYFMFKGKQVKYLFESPVINDRPLKTLDDLKPIEIHLEFMEIKKETARIFNGNMEEINHSIIDVEERRFPHLLEERLKELKVVIQVVDTIKAILEKMEPYNINNIDLYSVAKVKELTKEIDYAIKHIQYQDWLLTYDKVLVELKALGKGEPCHSVVNDLIYATETKDVLKWTQTIESLQELHDTKKIVNRFYYLLNTFNDSLPLTGKAIELTVGTKQEFPLNFLEAFELRKLKSWLDETKDTNVELLKKQIEYEHNEQKKLIGNIVSNSTWKNQVERITDEEKRALSAWKTYIKRFGKGSGKYAHMHLQGAREEMKTAQSAIPVWIMPINQVLENFPVTNEKFDVIIFDESSQCDIFSINVLLRGKKAIVVGDDEQISPQAIGTNLEEVYELVRRHLKGIPNANLFDGNISLYEIAEQTFPKEGKLMLREHFRCVPEIIQFSNDLSYGGEMIPLRLPLEEEKIDPPVLAIKVNDGYNDEREKDINLAEIEAIVADMEEMIHNPKYEGQTFGVITLQGQKQHKLLETKIREQIGDKEYVNRKVICGNPYTLQGDERDIIFLSMVVAPNRRFRSFTKSSEKQRFNVAASRAKNQMRLYHSVDLEELSSDDLRYRLLSYCKNPTRINDELTNLEDKCESPFEMDVLKMILAKGYKVTPQVEVGRYRIDLVVEGLRDRLAVECDGEKWHGPEKFEEDMQRQESLERAGWKFWRVRGRDFYFNRVSAMQRLWKQLDKMGIEPFIGQPNPIIGEGPKDTKDEILEIPIKEEDLDTEHFIESDNSRVTSFQPSKNNEEKVRPMVQTELFDSELNGFHSQISLFDEAEFEKEKSKTESFSLLYYFEKEGYTVIDKREKGGAIWVLGDETLKPMMDTLTSKNITFTYSPKGSRSTKNAPAWYSKYKG